MDTVALIGRLLVSLAAVLGVMWVLARRMKRGGRTKHTQLIDVLGRQQLSRSASVAVVRVGDQALIVGVTDGQVSVLGETDLGAAQAMTAAATETRRPQATGRRTQRTVRPATAPQRTTRTSAHRAATQLPVADDALAAEVGGRPSGPLAGSALSPQTWRQTLDSLRDLTARQA